MGAFRAATDRTHCLRDCRLPDAEARGAGGARTGSGNTAAGLPRDRNPVAPQSIAGPITAQNGIDYLTVTIYSISFRPLQRSDFPLLQEWLAAPHVAVWWNERPDPASVEAKYGPRVDGSEPTHVFVIERQGRPVGWIQWYLWADYPEHARQLGAIPSSAGMDLAIGEAAMTGFGLGPVAIREAARLIFSDDAVSAVVTDPEENNLRSLRAFEKAGFRAVRTVQLAGEDCKRQVMRLDRPRIHATGSTPSR